MLELATALMKTRLPSATITRRRPLYLSEIAPAAPVTVKVVLLIQQRPLVASPLTLTLYLSGPNGTAIPETLGRSGTANLGQNGTVSPGTRGPSGTMNRGPANQQRKLPMTGLPRRPVTAQAAGRSAPIPY